MVDDHASDRDRDVLAPVGGEIPNDLNDPLGCWTKINFSFPNLTSVQDTTTWSAQIQGDPVRLIEYPRLSRRRSSAAPGRATGDPGRSRTLGVTPTTLMLGPFAVIGLAAVSVLASSSSAWRGAAEHSRGFWLAWIVGFAALGFAGPATAGLGWVPTAWFVFWSLVGTLQPSMVVDVVEVRRLGRRQLAVASRPHVAVVASPPAIRWRAPASASVPAGWGTFSGG